MGHQVWQSAFPVDKEWRLYERLDFPSYLQRFRRSIVSSYVRVGQDELNIRQLVSRGFDVGDIELVQDANELYTFTMRQLEPDGLMPAGDTSWRLNDVRIMFSPIEWHRLLIVTAHIEALDAFASGRSPTARTALNGALERQMRQVRRLCLTPGSAGAYLVIESKLKLSRRAELPALTIEG